MFRLWTFNKIRLVRAFRRRGWQVKYCRNASIVITTPKNILFIGPDDNPDNMLGFGWCSLFDSTPRYCHEKTLRGFLRLFDEIIQ